MAAYNISDYSFNSVLDTFPPLTAAEQASLPVNDWNWQTKLSTPSTVSTQAPAQSGFSSFLSGVSDIAGSILDKAPAIIGAINQNKSTTTAQTLDAYGRRPGQLNYGTTTPPAGVTAVSTLPAWIKPAAIAGAVLLGVLLIWKMIAGRGK